MFEQAPLREQMLRLKQLAEQKINAKPGPSKPNVSQDLSQKIQSWLDGMTPKEKARPFTTAEVIALAQLKGKAGAAPPDHRVSQALRNLGFQHMRDWTQAGRNRRYWKYPGDRT